MRLKEFRKKVNLSQEQVANYINVNQRTYSGYELGKSEPSNEILIKLADLFHVSVDEILERKTSIINLDALELKRKEAVKDILNMTNIQLDKVSAFIKGMIE